MRERERTKQINKDSWSCQETRFSTLPIVLRNYAEGVVSKVISNLHYLGLI